MSDEVLTNKKQLNPNLSFQACRIIWSCFPLSVPILLLFKGKSKRISTTIEAITSQQNLHTPRIKNPKTTQIKNPLPIK
jgi:hypothetical protein